METHHKKSVFIEKSIRLKALVGFLSIISLKVSDNFSWPNDDDVFFIKI